MLAGQGRGHEAVVLADDARMHGDAIVAVTARSVEAFAAAGRPGNLPGKLGIELGTGVINDRAAGPGTTASTSISSTRN